MLKPTVTIKRTAGFTGGGLRARAVSLLAGPNSIEVGPPNGEMARIAIYNEFGTRGSGKGFSKKAKGGKMMGGFGGPVPERPFMRNAMGGNREKYRKMMASAAWPILKAAVSGGNVVRIKTAALRSLGAEARGDIQDEITSLRSPANAPLTIMLKGSSNPLIDTGRLRKSIAWELKR